MRLYPERPFVGVAAVVWRQDQFLLIRRSKPPREGQWSLPGGIQEIGETVFEAVRREIREETSLAVEPVAFIDVVDSIESDDSGRVRYHYTLIEVLAEWRQGTVFAGSDAAAAQWFQLDSLKELGLWSETERIIRLASEMRQV